MSDEPGGLLEIGTMWEVLIGVTCSLAAAIIYEIATRPSLAVVEHTKRAQGPLPAKDLWEIYHVKVMQIPPWKPFPGRRPAWSCKATFDVFRTDGDGGRAIEETIPARWSSQPEPVTPAGLLLANGVVLQFVDPAKVVAGRKMDVHQHEEQDLCVAIKYEGETECYLFSNESYDSVDKKKPNWALPKGVYRVRITVYYESGQAVADFELSNDGPRRDDLHLRPWPSARSVSATARLSLGFLMFVLGLGSTLNRAKR